jgi:hypothetical protein
MKADARENIEVALTRSGKLMRDEAKTKIFNAVLEKAFASGSISIVDDNFNINFALTSRNIEQVFMIDSHSLNAFEGLRQRNVIIRDDTMKAMVARPADSQE